MTRSILYSLAVWAVFLVAPDVVAQTTCDEVNPNVADARLAVTVTQVAEGFLYEYRIVNPSTNTGCFYGAGLQLATQADVADSDIVVGSQIQRFPKIGGASMPPGTYEINALPRFSGVFGGIGLFAWTSHFRYDLETDTVIDPPLIEPGQTVLAFTIVSSFPPGLRGYNLGTSWDDPPGAPRRHAGDVDVFGKTLGPTHPSELTIYNGGGQKPDDVNLFLRYTNPLERATNLRNTEKTGYPISILYGPTTLPATFKATLNRTDITSKFSPAPGKHEAVNITLRPGRNTLVFTIRGKNARGGESSDTDRLVLIVSE